MSAMLLGCVAATGADWTLASPVGVGAIRAAAAAATAGVAVADTVATDAPTGARGPTDAAPVVTTDGCGALAGRRRPDPTAATEKSVVVVRPPPPLPLPLPLPVVLSPKAPMGSPAAMTDRDA